MENDIQLNYKLHKEDFVLLQLFVAAHSNQIQKRIKRNRWLVPVLYLIIAILLLSMRNFTYNITAIVVIIFALIWYIFYPKFNKWRYKRFYNKYAEEIYQKRFGRDFKVTLSESTITMEEEKGKSELNVSEIERVIELKKYYLIKLKSSLHLIVPQNEVSDKKRFKQYFESKDLEWDYQLNWKWQ
ncbi:MAG: YcxB family protein [Flavobacteriales bacterium]|nr:YcxB family protein [Flavobacteriales bacterium]